MKARRERESKREGVGVGGRRGEGRQGECKPGEGGGERNRKEVGGKEIKVR